MTDGLIFRMYKLVIEPKDRQAFVEEVENNFTVSHKNEPGTLLMYATHSDEVGAVNYVFELYLNKKSYRIHADSSQFKRYGKLAQKIIKKKELFELEPILLSSPKNLEIVGKNPYSIRMTKLKVEDSQIDLLLRQTKGELTAFHLAKLDNYWLILEVSDDSQLYRDWTSFGQVINRKDLKLDTLVNQAKIDYLAESK